jgi:ubiquinone/menaquinone biosynthesis C-methylase UbiE
MAESVSFDRVAHLYDSTRGYPAEVSERIATGLMRLGPAPAGSSVLEIGIGTGRIALPLLFHGVNMTGVDISPLMVDQLRAKYDALREAEPGRTWGALTVDMADMTVLPYGIGSFDAAVAVHVLHLVPEWRAALDEVLRVVKPGGSFLLGQDVHPNASTGARTQDVWSDIIARLGYSARAVGALGYTTIVEELRGRGLEVTEATLATWETQQTPRDAIEYIAERTWSRTWLVPDEPFEASIRQLRAWADEHYAGKLDVPQKSQHSFKVARAAVK